MVTADQELILQDLERRWGEGVVQGKPVSQKKAIRILRRSVRWAMLKSRIKKMLNLKKK